MNSADAYESADILARMQEALHEPDADKRLARLWRLLNQAGPHADAGVVRDFALDHGVLTAMELSPRRSDQGLIHTVTWQNPCDGSEMIWIPPGPFLAGRPRPRQKWEPVTVPGFSLARYPVTNAQFKRFLNETGYHPPAWHPRNDRFLAHWDESGSPPRGEEQHPVVYVSHFDALHYCAWAGLTLPSERLWEKAARGHDGQPFPWGWTLTPERMHELINVNSDGTTAVGSYPRTRTVYGCEDMIGNVSEWCQLTPEDRPDHFPPAWPDLTPPENPEQIQLAVVRGSCFLRRIPSKMAAWQRRRLSRTQRNHWVGFRPACLLPYRAGS